MTTASTDQASAGDGLSPSPPPAAGGAGPRRSLVARQTLFVGFLVALTATALTVACNLYVGRIVTRQIDERLSATAEERQAFLLTAMRREEDRLALMAGRWRLRALLDPGMRPSIVETYSDAEVQAILDDVRETEPGVRALRLEKPDGEFVAGSGSREDLALIPADAAAAEGRGATPIEAAGRAAAFTTPVRSRSGELLGRLSALIDLSDVDAELSDPRWLGRTGEVLVGVPEGDSIRLLFPPRERPEAIRFPRSRTGPMVEAFAGRTGLTRVPDRFDHPVLTAYRPLGYAGWGVVVKIDADEAYGPVHRLRRLMATIGGAILLLGLGASYVLARRLARPILRLSEAAEAVADGRLDTPIAVASRDEVGVLESSFARMTDQLARSRADLETRFQERTADLEAVRDLLDAFFRISASSTESETLEGTFDSVLAFCSRLGYDLALISLVDREAGVIRGARGGGAMGAIVAETVRPLDGSDVLARVVRDGRAAVVPDATVDPSCDHEAVARAGGFRGQIVLPLAGGGKVLGTLQVAAREVLDPARVDLRLLETLAGHAGRTIARSRQVREVHRLNEVLDRRAGELARSEAALREQTDVLRSVLASMSEGVVVAAVDGRLPLMNPAARRLLDLAPDDEGGSPSRPRPPHLYPIGVPKPLHLNDLPLQRARRGETIEGAEIMIGHPSLQRGRCLVVEARPLRDDAGAVRGGVAVFQEITARKRAELRLAVEIAATRVLAESESLAEAAPRILQAVAENLEWDLAVLWRVDAAADRVRFSTLWRPAEVEPAPLEEALRSSSFAPGESLAGRVWADRAAVWIADLEAQAEACPLCRALRDDGLRSAFGAPVTLRGECIGVFGFFSRDRRPEDPGLLAMTAILGAQIGQFQGRCQMHARVVQSEKLASLGMLSASVAHEINNPLAYVSNNLAVLDRDVRALLEVLACHESGLDALAGVRPDLAETIRGLDEECDLAYVKENLCRVLDSTLQGARRVADIVHNLRGFARGDRGLVGPDAVDVGETISQALEMIQGRLDRRGIAVERQGGPVPPIAGSPAQLNQVFLNLLVNAMQAVEARQSDRGRIVVATALRGDSVQVEIRDDGCGMTPEVLAQVFDPFFTTKPVGEGTGLGLAISHGIVLDQGGRIEVESAPGVGSCFRVVLPVAGRKPPG